MFYTTHSRTCMTFKGEATIGNKKALHHGSKHKVRITTVVINCLFVRLIVMFQNDCSSMIFFHNITSTGQNFTAFLLYILHAYH